MNKVISTWGKDHWSLLAYIETRCVDYNGNLDMKHLRVNSKKRGYSNGTGLRSSWQDSWGTQMKNGVISDTQHDDIDVLEELEAEGFITNNLTNLNPLISLMDKGFEAIGKLRKHKANGGSFSAFNLNK